MSKKKKKDQDKQFVSFDNAANLIDFAELFNQYVKEMRALYDEPGYRLTAQDWTNHVKADPKRMFYIKRRVIELSPKGGLSSNDIYQLWGSVELLLHGAHLIFEDPNDSIDEEMVSTLEELNESIIEEIEELTGITPETQ